MFSAVIFDMDGVIVDSEPLHIQSLRKTLSTFDLDIDDSEFHAYMGRTPRMLLEDMIEKYSLDAEIENLYAQHMGHLHSLYANSVKPIPGALALIAELRENSVPLGLASSSDFTLIHAVLNRFGLEHTFTALSSGQEMEKIKPHPDIFLVTADRMGVVPAQCIVIEDSTSGIRAAKAAGMTCIGFRSPNSFNQVYDEADIVCDDLRDIDYSRIFRIFKEINGN